MNCLLIYNTFNIYIYIEGGSFYEPIKYGKNVKIIS